MKQLNLILTIEGINIMVVTVEYVWYERQKKPSELLAVVAIGGRGIRCRDSIYQVTEKFFKLRKCGI